MDGNPEQGFMDGNAEQGSNFAEDVFEDLEDELEDAEEDIERGEHVVFPSEFTRRTGAKAATTRRWHLVPWWVLFQVVCLVGIGLVCEGGGLVMVVMCKQRRGEGVIACIIGLLCLVPGFYQLALLTHRAVLPVGLHGAQARRDSYRRLGYGDSMFKIPSQGDLPWADISWCKQLW